MDLAYVPALAALSGSAIGGLTSLAASWLTQRVQFSSQLLAHDISRRQDLYKEFIEESSKCYAHAFENDIEDISKLVLLYALVSRMRVLSSQGVIDQADRVMQMLIETYRSPNNSIRDMLTRDPKEGVLDPLRDFSMACREEFKAAHGKFIRPG